MLLSFSSEGRWDFSVGSVVVRQYVEEFVCKVGWKRLGNFGF